MVHLTPIFSWPYNSESKDRISNSNTTPHFILTMNVLTSTMNLRSTTNSANRNQKWPKLAILATATLASLVFTPALQQQNVEAVNEENDKDKFGFNHHSHTKIDEKHGITGNEGSVLNEEDSHFNNNDNTNREDRIKCNSHSIPANTGDEGNVPC